MLEASYGPEIEIHDEDKDTKEIRFQVSPNVGSKKEWVFTTVELRIIIPISYPTKPAHFKTLKPRGLENDEVKELEGLLNSDADEHARYEEVHIFSAFQAAAKFLTDRNSPNPCPICYERIDIDGIGEEAPLQLKPCLHAMHVACYRGYRNHIEDQRSEKEASLLHREGPAKAARLAEIRWALCPVCRRDFEYGKADDLLLRFRTIR